MLNCINLLNRDNRSFNDPHYPGDYDLFYHGHMHGPSHVLHPHDHDILPYDRVRRAADHSIRGNIHI